MFRCSDDAEGFCNNCRRAGNLLKGYEARNWNVAHPLVHILTAIAGAKSQKLAAAAGQQDHFRIHLRHNR
eukprot:scaffold329488_cov44-Prasinocladus_malaysianus.AAC.2